MEGQVERCLPQRFTMYQTRLSAIHETADVARIALERPDVASGALFTPGGVGRRQRLVFKKGEGCTQS